MRQTLGALRDLVRLTGFDVSRYPHVSSLNGHLARVLSELGINLILDVGANHGQFALGLRSECGYRGRIISFEPHEQSRRILEQRSKRDKYWYCEPFALGLTPGEAKLQTFASSDWNSLHLPDVDNLAVAGRSLHDSGEATCHVRRLDQEWGRLAGRSDRVFLKTDTQGHDLAVIEGAGERLRDIRGLLVESSLLPFYVGEPPFAELIARVQRLGFECSGFFPVSRRKDSLALTTVDVCFVAA